ncbi:FMN-binding protein [Arthrobacter sp. ZBG10]|uniref:FMN-binding protein n=1 Tax=Arthrobacter sp. ZBG10 TaxID=1676590 RepID=UPI00067F9B6A|nr:FMN-binding protein [Arthrobacter sp. ZBG10]KNH15447.1 FMN-binding protein [Arthrobacter sp. ZBG10]
MKTRGTVAAAVASAGILLAGWQAGTQAGGTSIITATGTTAEGSGGASGTNGSAPDSATTKGTTKGTTSGTTAAGTFTGADVQTRLGSVQVQITVAGGTITDVTALHLTDDDRKSIQISNRAAPVLRSEVLAAQSADVQTVSGATVTSGAYLTSLQAAIDAANL